MKDRKLPAVKAAHRPTISAEISPTCTKEKEPSPGNMKVIHRICWNWSEDNLLVFKNIAINGGVEDQKVGRIW